MTELALVTLLTRASLVECTEDGLGIDAKGNLLRLYRFEQRCLLFLPLLFLRLCLLPQRLLFLFLKCCA